MKTTIVKIEKQPEDITACFIECVVMPNGEIITAGKTIDWFDKLGEYIYVRQ